jgi:hypothetical protein
MGQEVFGMSEDRTATFKEEETEEIEGRNLQMIQLLRNKVKPRREEPAILFEEDKRERFLWKR